MNGKYYKLLVLLLIGFTSCYEYDPYECRSCRGSGREYCTTCKNTGYCSYCKKGYEECKFCKAGYRSDGEICTVCDGDYQKICSHCRGFYTNKCWACHGVRPICDKCNGTGHILIK